jgi:hypothetical protein
MDMLRPVRKVPRDGIYFQDPGHGSVPVTTQRKPVVDVSLPVESVVHQEVQPADRFFQNVKLPDQAFPSQFPAGGRCSSGFPGGT